jgi:hypothetical protein
MFYIGVNLSTGLPSGREITDGVADLHAIQQVLRAE